MPPKFIEYLQEANRITRTVDHLLYVTYPLIQDKKILIKILTELKKSTAFCINSILQYEYLLKRIPLYKDPKMNFKNFINKCAPRYQMSSIENQKITELFQIIENHKQSSMEFKKNNQLIILTETSQKIIKIETIKEFLQINKKLIENIKTQILDKI
ncbi:hypothetical protein HN832_01330 [archaeon]|jgi:hypothetical protein|nr:hypothetical protein [archaeon]MBT4373914.1 hypothetical protein [archaeon]MBT4532191.1 hypothetical protein [archaeon]MBT7001144.1 hypothetical protein [archaeon]MBT7282033.1 hypothetical protein [archaeon]